MLDEYVLVPDIFDAAAYSNPAFIDMCLPHLKEPLLQEALVRDLCDGGWSHYCNENAGNLHRLCKEIIKKLVQNNRLRRVMSQNAGPPGCAEDWCKEGIDTGVLDSLTGVIAGHATKNQFPANDVASIERLTGALWWQARSPSIKVERKTADFLRVLHRVLIQANSLMFIDPNLDPSQYNYREFDQLITPLGAREIKPRVEIHRSFCKGDGPARTFPTEQEWKDSFQALGESLGTVGLTAEVFFWDDFHERYLISDVIGIIVPWGFDVTTEAGSCSTWARMGRGDKDDIQRNYDPAARQVRWRFTIGQ